MELTALQLFLIGTIATILAQGIKLAAARLKGQTFSKETVTLIAFAASFGTAAAFLLASDPTHARDHR